MKQSKIVAIIQARLTSVRFPKKILQTVASRSLIQRVVDEAKKARLVDEVVIATPHFIPLELRAPVFIGNEEDVLKRYHDCAVKFKADVVVRVTADCPLVRSWWIDSCVHTLLYGKFDYVTNRDDFPDGWDVEVFTFRVLEQAHKEAVAKEWRGHVTPYMKLKLKNTAYIGLNGYRLLNKAKLSVDTQEDLEAVRRVYGLEK